MHGMLKIRVRTVKIAHSAKWADTNQRVANPQSLKLKELISKKRTKIKDISVDLFIEMLGKIKNLVFK
jgi:hypothetical protein